MSTMRAVRAHTRGGAEQLQLEDAPKPEPRAGEAWSEASLTTYQTPGRSQMPPGTVGPMARSGQWPRRSLMSCWSFRKA